MVTPIPISGPMGDPGLPPDLAGFRGALRVAFDGLPQFFPTLGQTPHGDVVQCRPELGS